MLEKLAPYRKFVVALVGAVISWVGVVVLSVSAGITSAEWFLLLSEVGFALGVYQVPNEKVK